MLKIVNLNAGYEDLQVLKDVSLELVPGSITVLMGPNGAGKTTLLKSIFNLVEISSGRIHFEDKLLTGFPAHELLQLGISFVPQGKINFDRLSVRENLLMGAYHVQDKKEIESRLQQVFEEFPVLKQKENEYAFSLSGGQQQMLAQARALMNSPKLLLLDEPSLGLAPKLVRQVFGQIKEINQDFGVTILIVEHNIKSVMDIADYGCVMLEGRIAAFDEAEQLKRSEILQKVFVGGYE